MDYKYIEQLLERYWMCETTPEEEQVLRVFFLQKDIPAYLLRYKDLFAYEQTEKEKTLGNDFDTRMFTIIEQTSVKAHRISLTRRLRPFYKAAAIVAITLTLGNAVQHSFRTAENTDTEYNYDAYKDTYNDPQVAYEEAFSALKMVSEGLRSNIKEDSIKAVLKETTEKERSNQ